MKKTIKCKTCKIEFKPFRRNEIIVSRLCPECRKEKQRLANAKQAKRNLLVRKKATKKRKKEKKKNSIAYLTKQADILFSKAVRLRDGKCLLTGSTENLQCSHIWGRSNKFIRWDLDNALTLTAGKHLYWWHKEICESVMWAKELLGDKKWEELKQKKNQYFKLTPEFIKERITFLEDYINNLI